MPLDSSNSSTRKKRRKRKRAGVIQTLDPGASPQMEGGFLDFFRSVIDAFIPEWGRGGPSTSLSTAPGQSLSSLGENQEPSEERESSMANLAEMGAPILPAILFITSLVLLGGSFFTGSISNRLKFALFRPSPPNVMEPGVRVWVNKASGTFYCDGSVLYGNGSGEYMKQGDALTMGYQPALDTYCRAGNSSGGESDKKMRPSRTALPAAGTPGGAKSYQTVAFPR